MCEANCETEAQGTGLSGSGCYRYPIRTCELLCEAAADSDCVAEHEAFEECKAQVPATDEWCTDREAACAALRDALAECYEATGSFDFP